jgi:DNA-binding winged helix-turn-helix (wHTH) protein/tetratricopeptide (TPR) repeat protein
MQAARNGAVNRESRIQIPGEIQLADEAELVIGGMLVRPATLEILLDGNRQTIEPRMMQLLVALARSEGQVVSRDSLVFSCWSGRAVGDDAINRCVAKVRRLADGAGGFRIETINRVGYRLVETVAEKPEAPRPAAPFESPRAPRLNRRLFLGAGAAAVVAATTGFFILGRRGESAAPSPDVAPLMQQAMVALGQDTREGQNQAIGLYQRAVAIAPDYADGWGELGYAYAAAASSRPLGEGDAMRARAMSAGRRALALDPDNSFGRVALATAMPLRGNWLSIEGALRDAVSRHAGNQQLLFRLASVLGGVGRDLEALALVERMMDRGAPPLPHAYYCRCSLLWAANRLDEADRLLAEAASIYPTHFSIWFVRFYMRMYSGRAGAAIAMVQDRDSLPSGIPLATFDGLLRAAHAIQSRDPQAVASVLAENLARAHQGAGHAENAIAFACAVDRIDEAFALAEAYYFGRGFVVPDLRFSREQGTYSPQRDRITHFLFVTPTQPMRSDPRFGSLAAAIGLDRYWAESGHQPDYRRTNS